MRFAILKDLLRYPVRMRFAIIILVKFGGNGI